MYYYIYVKNIIGVKTDIKEWKWQYGSGCLSATKEEYDECLIKVSVCLTEDLYIANKKHATKERKEFHRFTCINNGKELIYIREFGNNIKLGYSIYLEGTSVHLMVGKNYYRHIRHRFMNLHSIESIISDIVCGLLLINGYATIYCSVVNLENTKQGILLFGAPNTGKTLTCMQMCEIYGARFMSEDVALTDGLNVWSIPWTNSYREKERSFLSRMIDKRKNRLEHIYELCKSGKIVNKCRATDLVVLEKGKKDAVEGNDEIINKVSILNRYLLWYRKSPALLVFNYFNGLFSIEQMERKEKAILHRLCKNVTCFTISEDSVSNFCESVWRTVCEPKLE